MIAPQSNIHDGLPDRLPARTLRGLSETDAMSPDLRQCVHEFGYAIVHAMMECGVSNPGQIRQLVHEVWSGARQPGQRQIQTVAGSLDWLLIQSGAAINAATLLRVLRSNGMVIVTLDPSDYAVQASMDAIKEMGVLSKPAKHRARLRAAIAATVKHLWPQLEN
jgi:hypothetical protein